MIVNSHALLRPPGLELLAIAAGLLLGPLLLFLGPRLAARRVEGGGDVPGPAVLVPLAGGWLSGWRPLRTLGFEVTVAAVFGLLAWHYGAGIRLPIAAAFSALFLIVAYVDFEHRLVLNWFSYPGIAAALAVSPLWPGLGPVSALEGGAVALVLFGALMFISRGALGMGDAKLAILVGVLRGFPNVFNALVYGLLLGGLGAIFYLVALRRGRKEYMPYGPYLAAGAILSFFLLQP